MHWIVLNRDGTFRKVDIKSGVRSGEDGGSKGM